MTSSSPFSGMQDPGEALEQRALARPVGADDAERRPGRHLERDVLERPELLVAGAAALEDRRLQVLVALVVEPVALPERVDGHGGVGHALGSLADGGDANQPCRCAVGPCRPVAAGGSLAPPMHAVADVYHSRELLWNLTLRELRTKYRRSFLGWAWSMLNPLATVPSTGSSSARCSQSTAPVGVPSGLTGLRLLPAVRAPAVELLRAGQQPRARLRSRPTPGWCDASRSRARCSCSPTSCTPACSSRSR